MPEVILIGDSIRMGYQTFVQEELGSSANVWAPEPNGGTSENVLAHLDEWILSRTPDLVHLNCGLHDLRKAFDTGEVSVPLDAYRANVEQILSQIQDRTNAGIIWATTTPVNEQWHHENKGFDRFEADVLEYNRVSVEIAQRLGIQVNNLYAVVMTAGRDALLGQDGVHFKEEGYLLLGKAVAAAIRRAQSA